MRESQKPAKIYSVYTLLHSLYSSDFEPGLSLLAFAYADVPAVSIDNLLDDSQPKPSAFLTGRVPCFENSLTLSLRNPSAGVRHVEPAVHLADTERDALTTERAVIVDESPGEAYFSSYGERYMDHAVWLADALVGVDNREGLLDSGLGGDTWVSRWLEGKGDDVVAVADAIDALEAASSVADAVETAADILAGGGTPTT